VDVAPAAPAAAPGCLRVEPDLFALDKTGRALSIEGDLTVQLGWPLAGLGATGVQFANPAWAQEVKMFAAQEVTLSVKPRCSCALEARWRSVRCRPQH
jgi:hypothetical protein